MEEDHRSRLDDTEVLPPKRTSFRLPLLVLFCVGVLVTFAFWVSRRPIPYAPEYGGISRTQQPGLSVDEALKQASEKIEREKRTTKTKAPSGETPAAFEAPEKREIEPTLPPVTPPATGAPLAENEEEGSCPVGMVVVETSDSSFCIDKFEYPGEGEIPRTQVSWQEASDVCEKDGKRLCSGKEWQSGCRGQTKQLFPYGGRYRRGQCNTSLGPPKKVAAAGTFSKCVSPVGALDMAGNVSEWVAPGGFTKGGSAKDGTDGRCPSKEVRYRKRFNDVGFRCCRDR